MLYHLHTQIQFQHETDEQFLERSRRQEESNKRVDAELARWGRYPMKALWPWCRIHAPHLLPEWADESIQRMEG